MFSLPTWPTWICKPSTLKIYFNQQQYIQNVLLLTDKILTRIPQIPQN